MGRVSFQTAERRKCVQLFKDGNGRYFENYRTLSKVGPSLLIKRPQGPRSKSKPSDSLKAVKPSVGKEWHPEWNNGITPDEVKWSSNYIFYWRCKKNKNHYWAATINSRSSSKGHGCPMCSGRFPTEDYNLARFFPDHAEEWHPKKNGDLTPWDVTPYSNQTVYWKRKVAPFDEWATLVNARTLKGGTGGKGYRSKLKGSSLFENFIYWQLKSIFGDTENRTKKEGREIDICVPSLKLGVEYDSLYFHRLKKVKDRLKIQHLESRGWRIIRLRQFGLKKERADDLVLGKGDNGAFKWNVVERVLKFIKLRVRRDKKQIQRYFRGKKLQNMLRFRSSVIHINNVTFESSLQFRFPEVAKAWDYKANFPITPRDVSYRSAQTLFFKCPKCSHRFSAAINNMVRSLRYKSKGCPSCTGRLVTSRDNLKAKFPQLAASSWDFRKNRQAPETFSTNSNKYAYWICRHCKKSLYRCINSVTTRSRERKRQGYFICYPCRKHEAAVRNKETLVPRSYRANPTLRKEWDTIKNTNKSLNTLTRAQAKKAIWWICSYCKGSFSVKTARRMKNFRRGKHGCPLCRYQRVVASKAKTLAKRRALSPKG